MKYHLLKSLPQTQAQCFITWLWLSHACMSKQFCTLLRMTPNVLTKTRYHSTNHTQYYYYFYFFIFLFLVLFASIHLLVSSISLLLLHDTKYVFHYGVTRVLLCRPNKLPWRISLSEWGHQFSYHTEGAIWCQDLEASRTWTRGYYLPLICQFHMCFYQHLRTWKFNGVLMKCSHTLFSVQEIYYHGKIQY